MCPGQGRNIGDGSGECLCGDGDIVLQSQKPGEPLHHTEGRSYGWDLASPLPLPHAGLGRAHGEADGARQRKEGSKCFPRWSRSWHLSSLTSAPVALTGPSWLPAASLQLPAPRPLAGSASPAGAGSREERAGLLGGPAPPGSCSNPAERRAAPRLPVSSACLSLY